MASESSQVPLSRVFQVITAVFATVISACVLWIMSSISALQLDMARMRSELQIVSPSDISRRIADLDRKVLDKKEFVFLLDRYSPWKIDRPAWEAWKNQVMRKLDQMPDK